MDQKLNLNINLDEIWYLGVPGIINYKLEFINQKFKTMDPIWWTEIIIIIIIIIINIDLNEYLDEI